MKIGSTELVSHNEFPAFVASLRKRSASVDRDTHRAAVSVLAHVRDHGDKTGLKTLIEALPKQSRKLALIAWCNAHCEGAMAVDPKGNIELVKGRKPEMFRVEEAEQVRFWEFTKEVAPKPVTLTDLVSRLSKGLKKVAGLDEAEAAKFAAAVEALAKQVHVAPPVADTDEGGTPTQASDEAGDDTGTEEEEEEEEVAQAA